MQKIHMALRESKSLLVILLLLGISFSCQEKVELTEGDTQPEVEELGWATDPRPEEKGPYKVCFEEYSFVSDGRTFKGKIYYPVTDTRTCRVTGDDKNLAIILHKRANVADEYLLYDKLSEHLASNAIAVASISWEVSGKDEFTFFPTLLEKHVDHIYNNLLSGLLTDNIALIGHSYGGKLSSAYANEVNLLGKNLKAVVNLAGATNDLPDVTFEGVTDAFLGCIGFTDTDPTTYGEKLPGEVMKCVFRIYDEAGTWGSMGKGSQLTKDFIYSIGTHDLHTSSFWIYYINAFLQQHLNGHSSYGRFFKTQERINGYKLHKMYQQHAEPRTLVLCNFDNDDDNLTSSGGPLSHSSGISNRDVGEAHLLDDPYSPHHSLAMRFDWNPTGAGPHEVRLNFPFPVSLRSYRYLSFRMGQVHLAGQNKGPLDARIKLVPGGGGFTTGVNLSDYNREIPYPDFLNVYLQVPGWVDMTKSFMQTYVIRLSDFRQNLSNIEGVTIDFSVNNSSGATLMMDDVEFLR